MLKCLEYRLISASVPFMILICVVEVLRFCNFIVMYRYDFVQAPLILEMRLCDVKFSWCFKIFVDFEKLLRAM
jgi:hypothetical protein